MMQQHTKFDQTIWGTYCFSFESEMSAPMMHGKAYTMLYLFAYSIVFLWNCSSFFFIYIFSFQDKSVWYVIELKPGFIPSLDLKESPWKALNTQIIAHNDSWGSHLGQPKNPSHKVQHVWYTHTQICLETCKYKILCPNSKFSNMIRDGTSVSHLSMAEKPK